MPIGAYDDFKIYPEQYYGGMYESIVQNINAFNSASQNALRLINENVKGHYEYESFIQFKDIVSRRDISSTSSASDLSLSQEEFIAVKLNRILGPVAQTLDAWKKIDEDPEVMSFILGQKAAEQKTKDYLHSLLLAVEAAIDGQSDLKFDATGEDTKTLTHSHLVSGMAKMGDQGQKIVAWVMHSKPYWDLVGQAITDKITNVSDTVIYGGSPGTLGRPVIVTDDSALKNDNGSLAATYNVLGLVEGAGTVKESEPDNVAFKLITGLNNLVYRYQGEYAFNVGVKGFQWDTSDGGENPSDSDLGSSSNWDKVATDTKSLAGVRIEVE